MKIKSKRYKKNIIIARITVLIVLILLLSYYLINTFILNNKKGQHNSGAAVESINDNKDDDSLPSGGAGNVIKDNWKLILVNKQNALPESFTVKLKNIDDKNKVDERIYEPYMTMVEDAKNDGINLLLISSYRTVERSKYLFDKQVNKYLKKGYGQKQAEQEAEKWVAKPYMSEHHTGLSVDILTPKYTNLDHGYKNTTAAKWLFDNAYKYGFILRYPEDKQHITTYTFEPWHYRYVGLESASYMKKNNLCLEEFLNLQNNKT